MSNFHKYARERDERILAALDSWQCLDTFQLALMFFPSRRMARKRLQDLHKKKAVKRVRLEADQPNVYYLKEFDVKVVEINWARLYLERKRAMGDKPIGFDYKTLTLTYENPLTKQRRQTRIETGRQKLSFGGSVFYLDSKKLDEIREEFQ